MPDIPKEAVEAATIAVEPLLIGVGRSRVLTQQLEAALQAAAPAIRKDFAERLGLPRCDNCEGSGRELVSVFHPERGYEACGDCVQGYYISDATIEEKARKEERERVRKPLIEGIAARMWWLAQGETKSAADITPWAEVPQHVANTWRAEAIRVINAALENSDV